MEQAHFETSHLQYNDENALSYTVSLALYAARNFYQVYREFPSGSGFADIVYLPRKGFDCRTKMEQIGRRRNSADIKKTIFPESGRLFRKYAAGWNQL